MRIKVFLWMSTVFTLLVSCTGKNEQVRSGMIVKTEKAVQYSGGNGKEYAFISRPYRTSELSPRLILETFAYAKNGLKPYMNR